MVYAYLGNLCGACVVRQSEFVVVRQVIYV